LVRLHLKPLVEFKHHRDACQLNVNLEVSDAVVGRLGARVACKIDREVGVLEIQVCKRNILHQGCQAAHVRLLLDADISKGHLFGFFYQGLLEEALMTLHEFLCQREGYVSTCATFNRYVLAHSQHV